MTIPTLAAPCPDCGAAMQDRGDGLECPACPHVQGWEPLVLGEIASLYERLLTVSRELPYKARKVLYDNRWELSLDPEPPAPVPPIAADCPRCCQVEYGITHHCADHCEEGMPF